MQTDVELMMLTQQGDREAYNQLVVRYQSPLVNFFYKLNWDKAESEDMAQDVFIKVYLARATYTERSRFSTYLFRVATNYWIDYLRTRGKRKAKRLQGGGDEQEDSLMSVLSSSQPTPQEELILGEQMTAMRAAIDSLPEEQKLVFVLSETQGMKYQEIADTLDIPLGTVKSRIHAAVLKLRTILVERGIIAG